MMYRVLELRLKLQERRGRGGKLHRALVSVSSDDRANGKRSESSARPWGLLKQWDGFLAARVAMLGWRSFTSILIFNHSK